MNKSYDKQSIKLFWSLRSTGQIDIQVLAAINFHTLVGYTMSLVSSEKQTGRSPLLKLSMVDTA